MELDALEFLRRFLQHVLPPGFQKVRHYGFLSPRSDVSLRRVQALIARPNSSPEQRELDATLSAPTTASSPATANTHVSAGALCPHCGGRLRIVAIVFHRAAFQDSR